MMKNEDPCIAEILEAIGVGRLSCREFVLELLEQEKRWSHVNSLTALDAKQVLQEASACDSELRSGAARGPLHGIPFVCKDNIDTVDFPTSAATPALRFNRPRQNATVVERLLAAGAILFGKANMHELAFGVTNNHGAFGPARNPYNPMLIPGGSSGGTAAAVAAGIAPFGLGSDTGGSVRLPAALCGLVGFRPTTGRYPSRGVVPISPTRDTVGPLARTVSDVAIVDSVLAGDDGPVSRLEVRALRLGIPRGYFFDALEPGIAARMAGFLDMLRTAGADLVEADIPEIERLNQAVSFVVVNYEARAALESYLLNSAPGVTFEQVLKGIVSPDVRSAYAAIASGDLVTLQEYRAAVDVHRPALQARLAEYFARHHLDAYLIPPSPMTARPIGHDESVDLNGRRVQTFLTFIRNADPSSNAGIPSIAIPIGLTSDGLPAGVMLEGPVGSDRRLLSIALTLEQLSFGIQRPRAH